MPLNDAFQLQLWISVSLQNAYTLNRISIVEKTSLKPVLMPRFGIFQDMEMDMDISIVADILAPRIARSLGLTK